jgi:D-alanyl-D-alanine carboxypeptidase
MSLAAPYAAMVMDARTGEVLHSRNADTRLHPASLTKMMTLYIAFEAVRLGEISLDTDVRISRFAAAEPPSKLGLRPGQKIKLRYLIRAAAVKSANDAATAIGEAISGSEAAFSQRMNRTAKALGMNDTTFKNAHGLTEAGHLSTARDMTTMGRRLFHDYPEYYNIFSRQATETGMGTVRNTNRRLLSAYRGADGIKTGYTRAAGFNLVASAERGEERIIATVFGGRSSATRNAHVAELLDLGFSRAPSRVAVRKPQLPQYGNVGGSYAPGQTAVATSVRPVQRPDRTVTAIAQALQQSAESVVEAPAPTQLAAVIAPRPAPRDALIDSVEIQREVVTRATQSSGRQGFEILLEPQVTRSDADKLLLRTALQEIDTLDTALRQVRKVRQGYMPSFVGLSQRDAQRACMRLLSRQVACEVQDG